MNSSMKVRITIFWTIYILYDALIVFY